MSYVFILGLAWLFNGSLKFAVNWFKQPKNALSLVGYGGFPSTHTAVVSALLCYVGLRHGFESAAFGIGLAVLWVTIVDARSLRRMVGRHSAHLNQLDDSHKHRERVGHSGTEIVGGLCSGAVVALAGHWLLSLI